MYYIGFLRPVPPIISKQGYGRTAKLNLYLMGCKLVYNEIFGHA